MALKHSWTVEDIIVAFYLYKFKGQEELPFTFEETSRLIVKKGDASIGSLKMALGNFEAIDTGCGGLDNYSTLQKNIYDVFKDASKDVFQKIVLKILTDKSA